MGGVTAAGVSANLTVFRFATASVTPVAPVAGTSPPDYALTGSAASLNQSLALGVLSNTAINQAITTGLISTSASATLPAASGSATVNNLSTGLTTRLSVAPSLNILGIAANSVTSTSSINASGPLTAIGTTSITGLNLSGLALGATSIDGAAFVNPAVNAVLLNVLGLRIVLNEQLLTGDGLTTRGLTTNAIHATFTNFLVGGGLLSGDLIVGQSTAAGSIATAVPEPASLALLLVGFAAVDTAARRRQVLTA